MQLPARPDGLDSPIVPKIIRLVSRANVGLYRLTGGRLSATWRVGSAFRRGVPICLLTTRGRTTGVPRTTPLLCFPDGERVLIVASQGGLPRHPQWYLNLVREPDVEIQIGNRVRRMRARTASAAERAELWPRLVEQYAEFATYQAWTEREIPVVICESVAEEAAAHPPAVRDTVEQPHWALCLFVVVGLTVLALQSWHAAFYAWWTANVHPLPAPSVMAAIFIACIPIHIAEAIYVHRLAHRNGMTRSALGWSVQTLLLGFPSTHLIRKRVHRR